MSVTTAGEEDVDMNARGMFFTQQQTADNRGLIVLSAAAGDVSAMLQHLRAHPSEVYIFVSSVCVCVCVYVFCERGYTAKKNLLFQQ